MVKKDFFGEVTSEQRSEGRTGDQNAVGGRKQFIQGPGKIQYRGREGLEWSKEKEMRRKRRGEGRSHSLVATVKAVAATLSEGKIGSSWKA